MIRVSFSSPSEEWQDAGIDGMGRGDELAAKIQTPSISCVEDRGRPKIHCLRDQAIDGLPHLAGVLHWFQRSTPLALSRSVSGRFHQTAGKVSWLPARARRSRPSQSVIRSVANVMEATQSPVHSGGNRAGFTPASLVTLYGHLWWSTRIVLDSRLKKRS